MPEAFGATKSLFGSHLRDRVDRRYVNFLSGHIARSIATVANRHFGAWVYARFDDSKRRILSSRSLPLVDLKIKAMPLLHNFAVVPGR